MHECDVVSMIEQLSRDAVWKNGNITDISRLCGPLPIWSEQSHKPVWSEFILVEVPEEEGQENQVQPDYCPIKISDEYYHFCASSLVFLCPSPNSRIRF